MTTITMDTPVQTRSGHPVKLLAIEPRLDQPIVGIVYYTFYGTIPEAQTWNSDGSYFRPDEISPLDLVPCA